jgi:hypothetical protein
MHLTLKERLKLKVGNETNAMMTELMDFYTIRDMLLEYDKLRRGLTTPRLIAGGDNTIFDPSRAPEGAGVFYGVNFAPYDLFDDNGRPPPRGTRARKRWPMPRWHNTASSIPTSPMTTSPAA